MAPTDKVAVVILGAGILGLSIAQELHSHGVKVAIVGRELPEDIHSAQFASPWAGANWASYAANPAEEKRDTITFKRFGQLAETHPHLVRKTQFKYVWNEKYDRPWYKDVVREMRDLRAHELIPGFKHGITFGSFTVDTPNYLAHLASSLRSAGIPIIRHRVSSLDEAYSLFGGVSLVINATGLGSRTLLGVQDPKVHPARGQTVLVKAPTVVECYAAKSDFSMIDPKGDGGPSYIIPRPGPDGHVILGGTYHKDMYNTLPDPATAERILKDAYKLCPELSGGQGWDKIEVVAHNVGLRPAREGGMRLELEERQLGQGVPQGLIPKKGRGESREVGVVHAYGIGPAGYQASLGIAEEATELALGYLKKIGGRDSVRAKL